MHILHSLPAVFCVGVAVVVFVDIFWKVSATTSCGRFLSGTVWATSHDAVLAAEGPKTAARRRLAGAAGKLKV